MIKPARFSQSRLMQAADEAVPDSIFAGTRVSVDIANDGSGLTVHEGNLPMAARGARAATAMESQLLDRIAATHRQTGIPIAVAAAPPGNPQFADAPSRFADTSPYWAGAVMVNRTAQEYCTTGFGLYMGSSRFTLTAAHCAANGPDPNAPGYGYVDGLTEDTGSHNPIVHMGQSDYIHELYDTAPSYDLGVVRLSSGTNAPQIYLQDNPGQGSITVAGYDSGGIPQGGNYCVHGTTAIDCELMSGIQHKDCGLDPVSWPPLGRCVYTILFSNKDAGGTVICQGDSGGPVYHWQGGSVIASGTVSWGYNDAPDRTSPYTGLQVHCSYNGGVSVVVSALSRIPGLHVVTSSAP